MSNSVIWSTGSYLPENRVHNDELEFPETSRYLISQKTGVFARCRASPEQSTSDLAAAAARKCLERAGCAPEDVEGIIVSTSSPDRMQPATATRVQQLLGAVNAFAFDLNSVCSGSIYGIAVADALIRAGQYRNLLFVAAELYSKILNRTDFSTFPYFGDGAGAILLRADDAAEGVVHSIMKTDGTGCDIINVPAGGTMLPYAQVEDPADACFRMKGKAVQKFAVTRGPEIVLELVREVGVMLDEIACIICHQANINIIAEIARRLQVPMEKFYVNLFSCGNTASASVPIALDEAVTSRTVRRGDLIVTVAFGGGLSWGANLIRL